MDKLNETILQYVLRFPATDFRLALFVIIDSKLALFNKNYAMHIINYIYKYQKYHCSMLKPASASYFLQSKSISGSRAGSHPLMPGRHWI